MGEHIKNAIEFVTGPTSRIFGIWGMLCPVGIGTLVLGVLLGVASLDLILRASWQWPSAEFFKYCFAVEGPLLLLAGALVQAVLASLRSKNNLERQQMPILKEEARLLAIKRRDRWDVFGWGLVTVGALLSFLATFPWSLPAVQ